MTSAGDCTNRGADWNLILGTRRQAQYPSENFVRFVARNYYDAPDRSAVNFLDVGSGAGANTKFLTEQGFEVLAVDSSTNAKRHVTADIETFDFMEYGEKFAGWDCILDHNTLCHIGNPPIERIYKSLKPGGKLFSVCPADDTWRGTLAGKGYCRVVNWTEACELYSIFDKKTVMKTTYPDRGQYITSWVIEGTR